MNLRKIIVLLLIMLMSVTSTFALEMPSVDVDVNTGLVEISGAIDADKSISIIIENDGKRYYLDSVTSDSSGKYVFNTVLPIDQSYSAILSYEGQAEHLTIDTKGNYEYVDLMNDNTGDVVVTQDKIKFTVDTSDDTKIPVTKETRDKDIDITMSNSENKVVLNLEEVKDSLPKIEAEKPHAKIEIPKGTTVLSGSASDIELLTEVDKDDAAVISAINSIVLSNKKLDSVTQVIKLGSDEKVTFNDYITITLKGQKGKLAGYSSNGTTHAISKYDSREAGVQADLAEFAYEVGSDLYICTKHFTDFFTYTTTDKTNGHGDDEDNNHQAPKTVKLSVDLKTINRGYIISTTTVTLKNGDTVWSVLERELKKKNISYSHTFSSKYNSVYIESIDGEGEFDHGSGSGWMYCVNNKYPDYGASQYKLKDGDVIKWRYTTNLGVDLGQKIDRGDDTSTSSSGDKKEDVEDNIPQASSLSSTDQKLVSASSEAKNELIKAAKELSNSNDAKVLAYNCEKALDDIITSMSKAKSQITIAYLNESFKAITDITLLSMAKLDDLEYLTDVTNTLLEASKQLNDYGIDKRTITLNARRISDNAMKYSGLVASEKLDDSFVVTAENVSETVNKLNSQMKHVRQLLKTNGFMEEKTLEKTLKFDISSDDKVIKVTVNAAVFDEMTSNGVDALEINSKLASVKLAEGTFDKMVHLSISSVESSVIKDVVVLDFECDGEFRKPVEVSIPYNGKEINTKMLTVFLLKDNGTTEAVGGVYDESTGCVKFTTSHFSKYFVKAASKSFNDSKEVTWATESIDTLAAKGIISGRMDNNFKPNDLINRAEFVTLITKMLSLENTENKIEFSDVNKEDWYYKAINTAYANDLVSGKSETSFDPLGAITREEMASMISNVLESQGYTVYDASILDGFNDSHQVSPWAKKAVVLMYREDLMGGKGNGLFVPKANTTRAEAAVVISKLYELMLNN